MNETSDDIFTTFVLCDEAGGIDRMQSLWPLPLRSKVLVRVTTALCPPDVEQQTQGTVLCEQVEKCDPFAIPWNTEYVVFLPDIKLESDEALRFQDLAFQSLRALTYDMAFLHLGVERGF